MLQGGRTTRQTPVKIARACTTSKYSSGYGMICVSKISNLELLNVISVLRNEMVRYTHVQLGGTTLSSKRKKVRSCYYEERKSLTRVGWAPGQPLSPQRDRTRPTFHKPFVQPDDWLDICAQRKRHSPCPTPSPAVEQATRVLRRHLEHLMYGPDVVFVSKDHVHHFVEVLLALSRADHQRRRRDKSTHCAVNEPLSPHCQWAADIVAGGCLAIGHGPPRRGPPQFPE